MKKVFLVRYNSQSSKNNKNNNDKPNLFSYRVFLILCNKVVLICKCWTFLKSLKLAYFLGFVSVFGIFIFLLFFITRNYYNPGVLSVKQYLLTMVLVYVESFLVFMGELVSILLNRYEEQIEDKDCLNIIIFVNMLIVLGHFLRAILPFIASNCIYNWSFLKIYKFFFKKKEKCSSFFFYINLIKVLYVLNLKLMVVVVVILLLLIVGLFFYIKYSNIVTKPVDERIKFINLLHTITFLVISFLKDYRVINLLLLFCICLAIVLLYLPVLLLRYWLIIFF